MPALIVTEPGVGYRLRVLPSTPEDASPGEAVTGVL